MQSEFEKDILRMLLEYAEKDFHTMQTTNPEFMEYFNGMEETEKTIKKLLPEGQGQLIERFDNLKTLANCYDVDIAYKQGLKDAVRLLRMLEVI